MIKKIFKIVLTFIVIVFILWGFSDSYSSHTIDNIVHVVAIGVDKITDNEENNIKVSFQFVNISSQSQGSSGGDTSTIVTSIETTTINKAINLMNSYIGKELNFAHCKVIVFSEDIAKEGIYDEICAFINNEELRPSTNIVISTSDANTYLKNSNPNIEKLVTNYYDTFELTSNFTGYSDDTTIGVFYNKLFHKSSNNTAILGRTFKKSSDSSSSGSSENSEQNQSSDESSQGSQQGQSSGESFQGSQQEQSSGKSSQEGKQAQPSANTSQSGESGKSTGRNEQEKDSGGASLEITGERGTQNVGIAVFKDDKYIGQLSEIESICHLLITNNVDSFVISIPMENYHDNLIDLNVSPVRGTKIKVDTSSDFPDISISVYCEAKILSVNKNSNYSDSETLEHISNKAKQYMKENIEKYLNKTSKEFNSDIAEFDNFALINFLTIQDWENYNWSSKYEKANFNVNIDFNVTSSLLFSGS